jgi:hypothetical protein
LNLDKIVKSYYRKKEAAIPATGDMEGLRKHPFSTSFLNNTEKWLTEMLDFIRKCLGIKSRFGSIKYKESSQMNSYVLQLGDFGILYIMLPPNTVLMDAWPIKVKFKNTFPGAKLAIQETEPRIWSEEALIGAIIEMLIYLPALKRANDIHLALQKTTGLDVSKSFDCHYSAIVVFFKGRLMGEDVITVDGNVFETSETLALTTYPNNKTHTISDISFDEVLDNIEVEHDSPNLVFKDPKSYKLLINYIKNCFPNATGGRLKHPKDLEHHTLMAAFKFDCASKQFPGFHAYNYHISGNITLDTTSEEWWIYNLNLVVPDFQRNERFDKELLTELESEGFFEYENPYKMPSTSIGYFEYENVGSAFNNSPTQSDYLPLIESLERLNKGILKWLNKNVEYQYKGSF